MAKYKLKSHKTALRRFHITGTGKILKAKGHKSHLRRRKAVRTKRAFHDLHPVHPSDRRRVKRLLPYGTP